MEYGRGGCTQVRLDALKEFQDENLQGNAMIEDLSDFGEKFRNVDIILGLRLRIVPDLKNLVYLFMV